MLDQTLDAAMDVVVPGIAALWRIKVFQFTKAQQRIAQSADTREQLYSGWRAAVNRVRSGGV